MTRLQAAVLASICSIVPIALFSEAMHDARVSLLWPRAEAVIVGEPRRGSPEAKRGHAYSVVLLIELPDGRSVTGRSLKPLFDEVIQTNASYYQIRRVSPKAGDRLGVRFDASQPDRIIPERELMRNFEVAVLVNLLVFGVLCRLLYMLFRGETPRLGPKAKLWRLYTSLT